MSARFCVISPTSVQRSWFASEKEASEHAAKLLRHSQRGGAELLVVQVKALVTPAPLPVEVSRDFRQLALAI